jgi:hypothetical protein
MNTKKYISGALALATVAGMGLALPIFAQSAPTTAPSGWTRGQGGMRGDGEGMTRPAVVGTVSAISGDILTVSGKQFTKSTTFGVAPTSTTITYTVDATNATVTKAGVASSVSAITIGDMVAVQGKVSGTNVTATSIRDGMMTRGTGKDAGTGTSTNANSAANLVAGNGQPIVGGSITAISGNTLTVTNKSNVTYTVDATNSKFLQGTTVVTISGLKVGDTVVVQGTVNGNNITASTVIDQSKPAGATTTTKHTSFFGGIGQFFSHLFGF